MKNGFIILLASVLVALMAWAVKADLSVALAVGIVTFLFALLGSLCYASDGRIDDVNARDVGGELEAGKRGFGGRCTSGSWR